MSLIENFFRRWSTVDITPENAILFEEHYAGVLAICKVKERVLLKGLHRTTTRAEFARRYTQLRTIE